MEDSFSDFIPIKDAANNSKHGNKSLFTLRKWVREGKLTKYKWGRDLYLKKSELVPQAVPGPRRRANAK
jgi:hypothetical protein